MGRLPGGIGEVLVDAFWQAGGRVRDWVRFAARALGPWSSGLTVPLLPTQANGYAGVVALGPVKVPGQGSSSRDA